MQEKMYVVGRNSSSVINGWDLVGVFRTSEEADSACLDETYFMGAFGVGTSYQPGPWPEASYPRRQGKDNQ